MKILRHENQFDIVVDGEYKERRYKKVSLQKSETLTLTFCEKVLIPTRKSLVNKVLNNGLNEFSN